MVNNIKYRYITGEAIWKKAEFIVIILTLILQLENVAALRFTLNDILVKNATKDFRLIIAKVRNFLCHKFSTRTRISPRHTINRDNTLPALLGCNPSIFGKQEEGF